MNSIEKTLVARVAETIRAHRLLIPGQRVLVAVSGGLDSVCLLDILIQLRYEVEIAHFDHQTRSGESAADAAFVRVLADSRELPFHLASRAVAAEAVAAGRSFEMHARHVRYEFLIHTAATRHCSAVATGHHRDDQAETVLMRIIRGVAPHGLAGIPRLRNDSGVAVVRPLIDCSREQLEAYATARSLRHRNDATNASFDHFRNRVRHELLPLLKQGVYNPAVAEALARLADVQRAEDAYLQDAAVKALDTVTAFDADYGAKVILRPAFQSLHEALQRRVLTLAAERSGIESTFLRIETARRLICDGATGARCDLGGGASLANGRDITHLVPPPAKPFPQATLIVPGVTYAFGRWFAVRELDNVPVASLRDYCGPTRQIFDADRLTEPLVVRPRRSGDRFRPLGMRGTKKLQDYFVDAGVPVSLRDQTPLVVTGGQIAWVVGHAIDARVALTNLTQRALAIEVDHDS